MITADEKRLQNFFKENIELAHAGGKVAEDTRKADEVQTGVLVITSKNASRLNQVMANLIESGIPIAEAPKEKNNFLIALKKRDLEWHLKCSRIPNGHYTNTYFFSGGFAVRVWL